MSEAKLKLQTPRGTHDILPEDHNYHTFIKKCLRHRCRQAGFKRITTPVFEDTRVFSRTVGSDTDIVTKEMYTFEDRGGNSLTLRPENTAGIIRAYIEHGMQTLPQPVELYYFEPMFRYERPQKGRYRELWQLGVEILGGKSDPIIDASTISLGWEIFGDLGVRDILTVQINTIGCPTCRKAYKEQLLNFYTGKERSLCDDCQTRMSKNPLRLLDCKAEDCQIIAELAPKFSDHICGECTDYHAKVLEYLDELQIPYVKNEKLVRGLDYYNRTVFEYWDKHKGAQNAVGAGGRFDGLAEIMGGPATSGIGFACGVERLIANMQDLKVEIPDKDKTHVFIAQLGDQAKKKCLNLINQLRTAGMHVVAAPGKDSLKSQLSIADRFEAQYCLILGEMEVRDNKIILRDMQTGKQEIITFEKIQETLITLIGEQNLDVFQH